MWVSVSVSVSVFLFFGGIDEVYRDMQKRLLPHMNGSLRELAIAASGSQFESLMSTVLVCRFIS